jgi:hypothetical protein
MDRNNDDRGGDFRPAVLSPGATGLPARAGIRLAAQSGSALKRKGHVFSEDPGL